MNFTQVKANIIWQTITNEKIMSVFRRLVNVVTPCNNKIINIMQMCERKCQFISGDASWLELARSG